MLVRSWNVFHGNSVPPSRRGYLREMIELATRDAPLVLCCQEIPVWALPRLETWSGMRAYAEVARRAWRPATASGWITRRHNGLFRSLLAGQANATLVPRSLGSESLGGMQVSDPGRERRVVHAVRVEGLGVVANLHLSSAPATASIKRAELERARQFVDSLAAPGEPRILAGDLNFLEPALHGYENGGAGIDHVLVAGAPASPLIVWECERRVRGGLVLSDHAPVEREIG